MFGRVLPDRRVFAHSESLTFIAGRVRL